MVKKKIEKELKEIHSRIKNDIIQRLSDFKKIWQDGNDLDIFSELVFCLLTPQMKPVTCWNAVQNLQNENLLLEGSPKQITSGISNIRFKNKRGEYIFEARKLFCDEDGFFIKSKIDSFDNMYNARKWFVNNVKGIGYKEASHFLRNIGKGEDFAILDRHILKNMQSLGLIDKIPASLSEKRYITIENKLSEFAQEIKIPLNHLDFIMWYKETGFIFK